MHIGIGAAILILGLLWLARSTAGLKVLAVLVVVVGGGAYLYQGQQDSRAACLARLEHYETEAFRRAAEQTCDKH
jgi:hypothetical protein